MDSLEISVCLSLIKGKTLHQIVEIIDDEFASPEIIISCQNNEKFWKAVLRNHDPIILERRGDIKNYKKFVKKLANDEMHRYIYIRRDVNLSGKLMLDDSNRNPEDYLEHIDDVPIDFYLEGPPLDKDTIVFVAEYFHINVKNKNILKNIVFTATPENQNIIKDRFRKMCFILTQLDLTNYINQKDNINEIEIQSLTDFPVEIDIPLKATQFEKIFNPHFDKNVNPQEIIISDNGDVIIELWISTLTYMS
jgi:hypothetical protein